MKGLTHQSVMYKLAFRVDSLLKFVFFSVLCEGPNHRSHVFSFLHIGWFESALCITLHRCPQVIRPNRAEHWLLLKALSRVFWPYVSWHCQVHSFLRVHLVNLTKASCFFGRFLSPLFLECFGRFWRPEVSFNSFALRVLLRDLPRNDSLPSQPCEILGQTFDASLSSTQWKDGLRQVDQQIFSVRSQIESLVIPCKVHLNGQKFLWSHGL